MNSAPQLINNYQQILSLSHSMLRHASRGEWDDLITQEVSYVTAVQHLARTTEAAPPSEQLQAQLRPVLRHILDNESEVRRLLQIRMDELTQLVSQSAVQKSMVSAYSQQGAVWLPQR